MLASWRSLQPEALAGRDGGAICVIIKGSFLGKTFNIIYVMFSIIDVQYSYMLCISRVFSSKQRTTPRRAVALNGKGWHMKRRKKENTGEKISRVFEFFQQLQNPARSQ